MMTSLGIDRKNGALLVMFAGSITVEGDPQPDVDLATLDRMYLDLKPHT